MEDNSNSRIITKVGRLWLFEPFPDFVYSSSMVNSGAIIFEASPWLVLAYAFQDPDTYDFGASTFCTVSVRDIEHPFDYLKQRFSSLGVISSGAGWVQLIPTGHSAINLDLSHVFPTFSTHLSDHSEHLIGVHIHMGLIQLRGDSRLSSLLQFG